MSTVVRRGHRSAGLPRRARVPLRAWLLLAASVGSIGLSCVAVSAAIPGDRGSDGADEQRETPSREEVLEYWTPERMAEAEPAEMPSVPVGCSGWGWFTHTRCW
ncbi:hypothetical protein [Streptomyces sp.]|uniref:hypothetical protein n=1 Tax=Streptomyces sp. TaxID=1931 RepID=UPI0028114A80|nr:hypothetical protein [Streptomyces sp.]